MKREDKRENHSMSSSGIHGSEMEGSAATSAWLIDVCTILQEQFNGLLMAKKSSKTKRSVPSFVFLINSIFGWFRCDRTNNWKDHVEGSRISRQYRKMKRGVLFAFTIRKRKRKRETETRQKDEQKKCWNENNSFPKVPKTERDFLPLRNLPNLILCIHRRSEPTEEEQQDERGWGRGEKEGQEIEKRKQPGEERLEEESQHPWLN
jgi:hypothetical protein